ncbi:MAG TPA: hypothetical protein VFV81_04600, partial [Verrucomicrobiae bacterium]|nr:hypothetical protein [Verrucomicrobiae bacterium]
MITLLSLDFKTFLRLNAGKMRRAAQTRTAVPRPAVRSSSQQAESLRRSRLDRALEIAQDYVEAIADLSQTLGEARVTDLARRLGVTHVTVNRTLAR